MHLTKSKYNRSDLPAILAYLVVMAIPLSALTTGGAEESYRYKLAGVFSFYEVPILILFPFVILAVSTSVFRLKMRKIDVLLVALLLISLVPIVINWGHLYQEAREYRVRLLSPFIAYMVYRACIRNIYQLRISILLILVPIIFQALMVIRYYLENERRFEPGLDMLMLPVILSFYLVSGLSVLFYMEFEKWRKPLWKMVRIGVIGILFAALIMAAGRMAVYGLLLGILIVPFIRKASVQRIFIVGLLSSILLLLLITAVTPEKDLVIEPQSTYEERWAVSRLVSEVQAVENIRQRLLFWKILIRDGMESPLFGHGLTAFDNLKLKSGATHSHSLFVGTFIASGLLGLILVIAIIVTNYRVLFFTITATTDRNMISISKVLFLSFFVLTLIAVTNDFKGGLDSAFFLFMAMTSKLYELHLESESVVSKIDVVRSKQANSTRILSPKKNKIYSD